MSILDDIKAAKDADSGYSIIPKGPYEFTVAKIEHKSGLGKAAYANKPVLNVTLRIVDDSPVAPRRTLFLTVPLFSRWNPTAKYPDGYPTNYVQFFTALGATDEQLIAGLESNPVKPAIPVEQFSGRNIAGYVKVVEPNEYNDSETNEVSSVKASTYKSSAPGSTPVSADVWGTPATATPASSDTTTPVAATAADPWAPAATDVAYAQQATQQPAQ